MAAVMVVCKWFRCGIVREDTEAGVVRLHVPAVCLLPPLRLRRIGTGVGDARGGRCICNFSLSIHAQNFTLNVPSVMERVAVPGPACVCSFASNENVPFAPVADSSSTLSVPLCATNVITPVADPSE